MPYIIQQQKVEFVNLGSKAMMEAKNVYMTEKAAQTALQEGEGSPSAAQQASSRLEEQRANEEAAKKKAKELNLAEQNFKRRLAAGAVGREEIMNLWTALHRPS